MLFRDALKEMMNGKYAYRPFWLKEYKYVALMPGMPSVWVLITQPNPSANNWLPLADDLDAEDWEILGRTDVKFMPPATALAA